MKRTKLKKQSKDSISKLQRDLWELCKQIIRVQYPNVCYTCGQKNLEGKNWHTGHMWAKASLGAYMKYDLRVLRPQCYSCNVNKGGMGADFYSNMLRENGKKYMEKLTQDRQVEVRAYDHYTMLLEKYKIILENQ
jgi:hypothetical protein